MALSNVFDRALNIAGAAFGAAREGAGKLAGEGWDNFARDPLAALAGGSGAQGGLAGMNFPQPSSGLAGAGWSVGGGLAGSPASGSGLAGGGTDPSMSRANAASAQAARNFWTPDESTVKPQGTGSAGAGGGATGAGLGSDQWVDKINQYAAEYGDVPDLAEVVQAVMELESKGRANAQGVVVSSGPYAGQRAQGLMQIMPGNYPGVNLLDPDTNIRLGIEMLVERYRRYGNWDSAVAAYLGAVDAQGRPTAVTDDNGTSGIEYAQIVNEYRRQIQAARAARPPTASVGSGGMEALFGGALPPGLTVTQGMERTPYSTGPGAAVYDYGTEFGLDGDTHTGWDIAVPRGTAYYLPAGLTGTVTKAGGTGVFRSNNGPDGPGRGELKILLSNGMEVIFGHSDRIDVRVGQQVTAGMLLGLTGSSEGDHMHLEVRVRDPRTRSGWRIVDPSVLFGGAAPSGTGRY